jgi:hypothetical protein
MFLIQPQFGLTQNSILNWCIMMNFIVLIAVINLCPFMEGSQLYKISVLQRNSVVLPCEKFGNKFSSHHVSTNILLSESTAPQWTISDLCMRYNIISKDNTKCRNSLILQYHRYFTALNACYFLTLESNYLKN